MTNLTGAKELNMLMLNFEKKSSALFFRNLNDFVKEVRVESNFKAPIDTQFMVNNAVIEAISNGFILIYKAPYSLYVHENLEVYHPNGEAKFLEKAVNEMGGKLIKRLGEGI